ncbi:hypothetical protein [Edaphobacter aggregans]|uniref:hypothetical protein n=1 Tax=Edaphobacter aggregans TaxID=570835 RepID=UPI00055365A3|nr:hypothetical protein [Edaphobacter aggregans]
MRRFVIVACFAFLACLAGCENHQARIDSLQKEYDRLADRFQKDCSTEMLSIPPKLSPKCQDEKNKQAEAWKRLQEEHVKK